MDLFLVDSEQGILISWKKLIDDVNKSSTYNPYFKSGNYYKVFKHIILSMIIGKEVILLDSDFTDTELINLTGNYEYNDFTQLIDKGSFPIVLPKEQLIKKLRNTSDDWKVTLFTSGTTGIPKKVTHNFSSITRFVKSGIKNVRIYPKSNSVLGNIICCEVFSDNNHISETSIRTFLQSKIQEFKIPRIIRFVEELSTTRTGKIQRN